MKKMILVLSIFTFVTTNILFAHDKEGHGKKSMALGHFKKMDVDGDNKVSKEEWQKFHDAHFLELDKDGDGSVSFDEMKAKHSEKKDKMKEKAKENGKQGKKKNKMEDTE
ncbi:EF-hand domain-containing protein [Leptospira jelokensis]|uniref:EF-hand domain-containing protein n=1 Tax=Leptospira jelokensis TaxID=2484931 RepID=A0A4Z1A3Z2_9LEPT|nr:EF-hand domain-containing protein [Leptospira jelokensis]TGL75652.1 hypothetical protein EHQ62_02145 [Leptospira jelokensis]TGM05074.1 hypothetical protein EHQ79_03435 [Leptospira jelokensis]